MAIKHLENGQIEVGGRTVRKRNPEELKTIGATPELPSILEGVLAQAGLDPKSDEPVRNIITRDDEFVRRELRDFEGAVGQAFVNAMTPAVAQVKNVMADGRFTTEAKRQQAEEAIAPARAKWVAAASKYLADLQNGLFFIDGLLLMALQPETPDVTPEVVEARARECREAVLSMPEAERAKLLLDLGGKAALEPLHAIKFDPLKREAAKPDVLVAARESAIRAQDGDWLLQDRDIQRRLLSEAAARLAVMEVGVNAGLLTLGLESKSHGEQWSQVANLALEKSEAVLL